MNIILEFEYSLEELSNFSKKIAYEAKQGDIFLLKGDLGVGKTTFTRFFINSLYDINKILKPKTIKSPTFPIMINYPFLDYEIYHYDLYRLQDKSELIEIGFLEESNKNISIIEWPDILLKNFTLRKFYLLKFEFIDSNNRYLQIQHSEKKQLICL